MNRLNMLRAIAVSTMAIAAITTPLPAPAWANACEGAPASDLKSPAQADAYLAKWFGALDASGGAKNAVRRWLECDAHKEAQSKALAIASTAAVANATDVLLTGKVAESLRKEASAEDADMLFGVLFHPAVLAHLSSADPAKVSEWDMLAGALEAAYEPSPSAPVRLVSDRQF